MTDEMLVSIAILAGVIFKLVEPFLRKVADGTLEMDEFNKNYLFNAIIAAVWTWLIGTGIYLAFVPPDIANELIAYGVAFVFGWGGTDAQEELVKVIKVAYVRYR